MFNEMDIVLGLQRLLIMGPVLLFSLSFHEMAHAWTSNRLGDPTARYLGRITLDPAKHIDLFGTIIIPFMAILLSGFTLIGWAKPVPFNPANFDNWRRDSTLVALAGPASNLLLAVVFTLLFVVLHAVGLAAAPSGPLEEILFSGSGVGAYLFGAVALNIGLAFFNMMPVPPLDGSHILINYLPEKYSMILRQIGFMGIIILILLMNMPGIGDFYIAVFSFLLAPFIYVFYY